MCHILTLLNCQNYPNNLFHKKYASNKNQTFTFKEVQHMLKQLTSWYFYSNNIYTNCIPLRVQGKLVILYV